MKTKLMMAVLFVAACFTLSSCGGGKKQQQAEEVVAAMSIDDVMAKAGELVDQTVVIEGVCTHTCSHGAKKMFLVGSDDSKTLRIEAGELGAFDTKVVNNVVTVKGIIKEERIDEAYLVDWESRLKNQTEEKHGNGEGEGGGQCRRQYREDSCSDKRTIGGQWRGTGRRRTCDRGAATDTCQPWRLAGVDDGREDSGVSGWHSGVYEMAHGKPEISRGCTPW